MLSRNFRGLTFVAQFSSLSVNQPHCSSLVQCKFQLHVTRFLNFNLKTYFALIEIGIVLHTHGDQPVMLPEENLEGLMNTIQPDDQRTFTTNWVVRYAVVVKCRGVIKTKGYIASIDAQVEK